MSEWDKIWNYLLEQKHLHVFGWKEAGWIRITSKKHQYMIYKTFTLHRVKLLVKMATIDNLN